MPMILSEFKDFVVRYCSRCNAYAKQCVLCLTAKQLNDFNFVAQSHIDIFEIILVAIIILFLVALLFFINKICSMKRKLFELGSTKLHQPHSEVNIHSQKLATLGKPLKTSWSDIIHVFFAYVNQCDLGLVAKHLNLTSQASSVAHDFNNVLAIILGNTELLLSNAENTLNPENVKLLKLIEQAAQLGVAQTRRLLTFAKKTHSHQVSTNLDEWLNEQRELIISLIKKDVIMTFNLDAKDARVKIDPDIFALVLVNLTINALDAIKDKGEIRISSFIETIEADKTVYGLRGQILFPLKHIHETTDARSGCEASKIPFDNYAVVQITDTGTGIPLEIQSKIFEPFFTTKPAEKGTGLGLSIVREIIEENNAKITLKSELGKGTSFYIYLNLETEPELKTPCGSSSLCPSYKGGQSESEGGSQNFEKIKISLLIVDDDPSIRQLSKVAFEKAGLTCFVAGNGSKALEVLKNNQGKINVALVDFVLPDMNGYKLAKKLKEILPEIKIILTTGYADEVDNSSDKNIFSAIIPKPYKLEQISNIIYKILR